MSARLGFTWLVAVVALASAAPASAFVQSRGLRSNECLSWKTRTLSYVVNGAGASRGPGGCPPDEAVAAVERGFSAWPQTAQACTDIAFVPGRTASRKTVRDGENVVLFRSRSCANLVPPDAPCRAANASEDCSSAFDCWDDTHEDVIATTSVLYVAGSGEIFEADMELNSAGFLLSCSDTAPATDIQNTATHEAGHFLGLAHPCQDASAGIDFTLEGCPGNTNPTMFPTSDTGETSKRSLDADDVAGVCFLYPRGEPTPVCVGVVQQPPGTDTSLTCGSASPRPGFLAVLAVPALLLLRRRPRTARARGAESPMS